MCFVLEKSHPIKISPFLLVSCTLAAVPYGNISIELSAASGFRCCPAYLGIEAAPDIGPPTPLHSFHWLHYSSLLAYLLQSVSQSVRSWPQYSTTRCCICCVVKQLHSDTTAVEYSISYIVYRTVLATHRRVRDHKRYVLNIVGVWICVDSIP